MGLDGGDEFAVLFRPWNHRCNNIVWLSAQVEWPLIRDLLNYGCVMYRTRYTSRPSALESG